MWCTSSHGLGRPSILTCTTKTSFHAKVPCTRGVAILIATMAIYLVAWRTIFRVCYALLESEQF